MKARVVFSGVGFQADGRRRSARRGEVVELSEDEFDRLAALGAVETFAGGGPRAKATVEETFAESPRAARKAAAPRPTRVRSGSGNR